MTIGQPLHPAETAASLSTLMRAVRLLEATGFRGDSYRNAHADLLERLPGPGSATLHFLIHGWSERRPFPIDLKPAPLAELRALPLGSVGYRTALVAALVQQSLGGDAGHCERWPAERWPTIFGLRAAGACPFVIVGTSIVGPYIRFAAREQEWLLPLPLRFPGRSATGLARPDSPHGKGVRALFSLLDRLTETETLPIFFKFGGIDAQYLYDLERLRSGRLRFDPADFEAFCRATARTYLAALDEIVPRRRRPYVDILSTIPPPVADAHRVAVLLDRVIGRVPQSERPALIAAAERLEMPGHREWTALHQRFNALLAIEAAAHDFAFVDDFTPFLGADGVIDSRFVRSTAGADDHIEPEAAAAITAPLLWRRIDARRRGGCGA